MRSMVLIPLLLVAACGGGSGRSASLGDSVLSLSWSPQYCAQAQRPDEGQCSRPYGFVVHGLWPQGGRGRSQDCGAVPRVSESTIERMLPIMPSRGLVIHEWRTHGACSGMDADAYFDAVTRAYRGLRIPPRYQSPAETLTVDAETLEREFVDANQLPAGALALECSGPYLQEVRVCLDPALAPRACGTATRDRCGAQVMLRPVR